MANVIFKFGTQAQYNALLTKNANTLYWLYDVLELRKGEDLYGVGRVATDQLAGLMSPADKTKLDTLIGKAHTHENSDVLNGITADKVAAWDVAEQNAKDYTDELRDFVADNYDAIGAADAAEEAAKAYMRDLMVWGTF